MRTGFRVTIVFTIDSGYERELGGNLFRSDTGLPTEVLEHCVAIFPSGTKFGHFEI